MADAGPEGPQERGGRSSIAGMPQDSGHSRTSSGVRGWEGTHTGKDQRCCSVSGSEDTSGKICEGKEQEEPSSHSNSLIVPGKPRY